MKTYGSTLDEDTIYIHWKEMTPDSLQTSHVLYALLDPRSNEILLIGQAYRQTVRQRLKCQSKNAFSVWASQEGLRALVALVGEIELTGRLTGELLADIESLLIYGLKPRGNVANVMSRDVSRPGMVVKCVGEWPDHRCEFEDAIAPYEMLR